MRIAAADVDGQTRFGAIDGDRLVLADGARTPLAVLAPVAGGASIPLASARLVAPVVPVRNVFCVGWNYIEHFEEGQAVRGGSAQEIADRPTFFTKATGTVIGPFDEIEGHGDVTETLDWEVELAVVIGRGGRDIAADRALEHVLGYAVANDVSARNVQRGHGGQWFRGKSLDRTCPIGPWIITPEEFGVPRTQAIRCRVNGEVVQEATVADMHFDVPRIIEELSWGLTLLAGDVILTGTPSGVGFARTPPRYLSVGDTVESEVEGIGTIRNVVAG